MPSLTSPYFLELWTELSRRLASGHSTEQIAREMDYPLQFVEQQLVREDFLQHFAEEQPAAYHRWRTLRDEEEVDQEVQHFLSTKALHNAKRMQELADSNTLRPEVEARLRESLMKMSGKIKDSDIVKVVKISAAHLAALQEGAQILDELEDD